MSGPCSVPSLPTSVRRNSVAPAVLCSPLTASSILMPAPSCHPRIITAPPAWSADTTTLSGPSSSTMRRRAPASVNARVPTTIRSATAAASVAACTERRPPATWTGMDTASATERTASRFDPEPRVASRSTTCSMSAPSASHRRAASTGLSPYMVFRRGSPLYSLTTFPPIMSTAGITFIICGTPPENCVSFSAPRARTFPDETAFQGGSRTRRRQVS